jgi:predicted chitinase
MSPSDRLFPPYGTLNPVEDANIGRHLDPRNTNATDILKETALAVFKKETLQNSGPMKGIVLRIDNNSNAPEPDSWITQVFGSSQVYSLKVLKVRIPEIHAALPEPSNYGPDAREAHKVIDMYPSFIAANEEISNKPIAPGDIALVDFGNRANLSQPIYLGPVISNATPGAVGEKSAQQTFAENKPNKLEAAPPPGDNVIVPDKKIENQIPQITEAKQEKVMPETVAQTTIPSVIDPPPPEFPLITAAKLIAIMPTLTKHPERVSKYLDPLNAAMAKFEVNTPKRQAAFLSQIAHESGQLRFDTEGPSVYSGPNFEKYENRKILGNNQPGDGPKFKGRGLIQLTGRFNYTDMTKKLQAMGVNVDLVNNPEIAARPDVSVLVAGLYFQGRNINKWADTGDIVAVSKAVNGGTIGLQERIDYYNRAITALS